MKQDAFTLAAPAKLNLFLHITGRRDDGYHDLQTVFQLLNVGDELTFMRRTDGDIRVTWGGPQVLDNIPLTQNLVYRAARLLQDRFPKARSQGADITLRKNLPSGGGLGGGSSDAATTLLGLNHLWGTLAGVEELAELGRCLGADVPVFVRGHSAWAEGVGERLQALELPKSWYLVIHPGCSVSTAEIFSHAELTRDTPAITIAAFFAGPTRNDCEKLVRRRYEAVDKALIFLRKFGEARMTGTGASVFAAFANEAAARDVQAQVPAHWTSFVAQGVNRSSAWEQLDTIRGS